MKMFRYFVAFTSFEGEHGRRFGSVEIEREGPIRDGADVKEVEREVARILGLGQVVVINWRQFECLPDEVGHG